jgi:hypothetical protein
MMSAVVPIVDVDALVVVPKTFSLLHHGSRSDVGDGCDDCDYSDVSVGTPIDCIRCLISLMIVEQGNENMG